MRIILLSGGSGKRLWPLSNEIRSKIYLKLLPTEEGGRESMIQRACRMLDQFGLLPYTSIVTNRSQLEITQHHVGDQIPILAEPFKRGTFLAVGIAASYFHSKQQVELDETICVIPVDSYVEEEFYQLLQRLPEVLAQSDADLALIGANPNAPSSQYGYIVPGESGGLDYLHVSRFVEKPNEEVAASLISENALWNCGVFAFPLSYMLTCLTNRGLSLQYEELLECYESFPVTSFDEEVVEKSSHCVVVPYNKAWRDLGDWSILPNYLGSHVIGLGDISSDSLHTHLINELMYPIHVIGLSNIIVAASPDGVLVAHKDKSSQIKTILKDWQTPMFEEKRWGKVWVIDLSMSDRVSMTRKVVMLPGKNTSYHMHQKSRSILTIINGTGDFILDGVKGRVTAGDVLHIQPGAKHAIKALCPLEYIVIQIGDGQSGDEQIEDDIVRAALNWDEIMEICE